MFQNPVAPRLTSASGLLALLEEDNDTLKGHALRQLISVVDQHWPEVAGALALCEALYEDEGFEARTHAALLASKVTEFILDFRMALSVEMPAGYTLLGEKVCLRSRAVGSLFGQFYAPKRGKAVR